MEQSQYYSLVVNDRKLPGNHALLSGEHDLIYLGNFDKAQILLHYCIHRSLLCICHLDSWTKKGKADERISRLDG